MFITIALSFLGGALFFTAFNRARWTVFPLTGGPEVLHFLGGPPKGPVVYIRSDAVHYECRACSDSGCPKCEGDS